VGQLRVYWSETDLSFTIAAGPRQRSHFRVRVPRDSWPYFTLSDTRLSQPGGLGRVFIFPKNKVAQLYIPRHWVLFSSLPTTRRATVDVFEPASTRGYDDIKSKSRLRYVTTDGQLASVSWCQAASGAQEQIFVFRVKVRVMLRPMVCRPVCLGVKHHLGFKTRFLFLSDSCGFVDVVHPLWREDGSVFYNVHNIFTFYRLLH
jgi:hypothetical protein